ncbi:elongation factor P maturation arginine rhamnosyltransferase EarP [Nitrosomonas eutropha]|nr:elongation factor P maturation arginine rhamnosyltransferase EarP [Nitrosomonas eutropha]
MRWDIFCHVVDNYGDVGVCWRLARQLATEFGMTVRLLVDDLGSLQRICPEVDSNLTAQYIRNIQILHWIEPFPNLVPADVVIEAFGCELPANYVMAMAMAVASSQAVDSVDMKEKEGCMWINLEYLSTESWVEGYHRLASPHPRLPLTKYFFFPGFTAATGGVIQEAGLFAQRDSLQSDPAKLWHELSIPVPASDETIVSLFCYDHAPVGHLLEAWVISTSPVRCLLPEGVASRQAAAWAGQSRLVAGDSVQRGNLVLQVLPFVPQENYDRLLWVCDCNFVRGEDSFVRAQWAARPVIWQIYPQQEDAHLPKLEAFLNLYCQGLVQEAADVLRALHQGWNNNKQLDWDNFRRYHKALQQHAIAWAEQLAQAPDLASNLVNFCRNQ